MFDNRRSSLADELIGAMDNQLHLRRPIARLAIQKKCLFELPLLSQNIGGSPIQVTLRFRVEVIFIRCEHLFLYL